MIHIYFCASLLLCPSEIFSDFSHISLSFLFGILTFSFTTFENDFFCDYTSTIFIILNSIIPEKNYGENKNRFIVIESFLNATLTNVMK